ncbi:MAG: chemotaxis protein CheW [SAR324 cluster bacterium]|nr:chemotaxis protein CheW [SAR324 cluster bacterium]
MKDQPTTEELPETPLRHFVVFLIQQRLYAISLSAVERVVRAVEVTSLIDAPAVVYGLINIEKEIIPVINLRHRFNLPLREIELEDQFIITRTATRTVALWVDAIQDILEFPDQDVIPSKKILANIEDIEGTIVLDDGMILIYNLNQLLSLEEESKLSRSLDAQV